MRISDWSSDVCSSDLQLTLVAENLGNIVGWQTDHEGRVRAGIASDGLHTTLPYRDTETDEFKPIITTDFRTSVVPQFFTPDNRAMYALSNRGRNYLALVIIKPADPEIGRETCRERVWQYV